MKARERVDKEVDAMPLYENTNENKSRNKDHSVGYIGRRRGRPGRSPPLDDGRAGRCGAASPPETESGGFRCEKRSAAVGEPGDPRDRGAGSGAHVPVRGTTLREEHFAETKRKSSKRLGVLTICSRLSIFESRISTSSYYRLKGVFHGRYLTRRARNG